MYEYRCKVVRVRDGDTVDVDIDLGFGISLNNERVRIMGIDTPESRTRDKVEKKFGLVTKIVDGFNNSLESMEDHFMKIVNLGRGVISVFEKVGNVMNPGRGMSRLMAGAR